MASKPTKTAAKPAAAKHAPAPVTKQQEKAKSLPAVKANTDIAALESEVFGGGDRSGFENVTSADITIPRITILQKLSPQLDKKKPEFVEGAEVGMFCDTSTGDVFTELKIIPVFYALVYLEWAPRNTGKGLVQNHGMDKSVLDRAQQDEKRKWWLPNGNYVAETATYFCLNVSGGNSRCFIPLASSGLKASRDWMAALSRMKGTRADGSTFDVPLMYRSWVAHSVERSNNEGDWYTWRFDPAETILELDPTRELLAEAKLFYEAASSGLVRANMAGMSDEDSGDGDNAGTM